MSKFNNTLQGKIRDSIAQQGGLEEQYKPKKKRVIWTIGNVLAIWACTVKEHSGTIKGDILYVHPLKKEQLNPRKLPWIRSKLPSHQKKLLNKLHMDEN